MLSKPKRKNIRHLVNETQYCEIDLKVTNKSEFKKDLAGIIISESFGGLGVLLHTSKSLHDGIKCSVKIGKMGPILSEVRWIKKIDHNIYKIGIMFLE